MRQPGLVDADDVHLLGENDQSCLRSFAHLFVTFLGFVVVKGGIVAKSADLGKLDQTIVLKGGKGEWWGRYKRKKGQSEVTRKNGQDLQKITKKVFFLLSTLLLSHRSSTLTLTLNPTLNSNPNPKSNPNRALATVVRGGNLTHPKKEGGLGGATIYVQ